MPIKIGEKWYASFERAAQMIAKKKGIPIQRARAYVATIERKQKKGHKQK